MLELLTGRKPFDRWSANINNVMTLSLP
jgi:hypothetical protein